MWKRSPHCGVDFSMGALLSSNNPQTYTYGNTSSNVLHWISRIVQLVFHFDVFLQLMHHLIMHVIGPTWQSDVTVERFMVWKLDNIIQQGNRQKYTKLSYHIKAYPWISGLGFLKYLSNRDAHLIHYAMMILNIFYQPVKKQ